MVQLNPKITASFSFHGTEMQDVEVINPGDWFGKTWLLGISCGFDTDFYIVEADSACDAIDELVDSGKGDALLIDEDQFGDYGVATDNPTCSFAGNNGRPVCLDNLLIHGDDRTGFECLYHVEGWAVPVKPKDLGDVIEKMELVAQSREDIKHPGKFQTCEAYAPYFWHSESNEDIEDRFGNLISRYEVTAEDRLMFPELANVATVYLRETEDDFVVECDEPVVSESADDDATV